MSVMTLKEFMAETFSPEFIEECAVSYRAIQEDVAKRQLAEIDAAESTSPV